MRLEYSFPDAWDIFAAVGAERLPSAWMFYDQPHTGPGNSAVMKRVEAAVKQAKRQLGPVEARAVSFYTVVLAADHSEAALIVCGRKMSRGTMIEALLTALGSDERGEGFLLDNSRNPQYNDRTITELGG